MHKTAMGLDTSYDNIISPSPYIINGKHIRIQWCKHTFFLTHFNFKCKYNPFLEHFVNINVCSCQKLLDTTIKIILVQLIQSWVVFNARKSQRTITAT